MGRLRIAALCLPLVWGLAVTAAGGETVVHPTPAKGIVLNPGKGWVLYGNAEWHSERLHAVANLGYRRFEWAELEPEEGRYNWQPVDEYLESWAKRGKQAAFGVMCCNSHTRRPGGYSTPKWVFDAGAAYRRIDLTKIDRPTTGTPGVKIVPDFDDPIFLEKLKHFLSAMGKRYDGDPRIAFYDVRSYGNWGEGHLWPFGGEPISGDMFRYHIQLHLDAFPHTRLCISCENKSGPHVAVYDWAVKEMHCAARRDGICGNSDGSETLRAFGVAPAVFELFAAYPYLKEVGWWYGRDNSGNKNMGYKLEDCVERGKPSYIDLSRGGKTGEQLLDEEPELVRRLANRMGYHFVLETARFMPDLRIGTPIEVRITVANRGVAPIYIPCVPALALLDADGRPVAVHPVPEVDPHRWMPDETTEAVLQGRFDDVPPGRYRLAVGLLADVEAEKPAVRFAVEETTDEGWCLLGTVTLASGK